MRREHFLDAAEETFFDRGVDGTTMQDIAESAGFSVGMIYQYFDSKEDLCVEIIRRRNQEILDRLDEIVDQEPRDVEGTLRTIARDVLEYWEGHRRYMDVFYSRSSSHKINTQAITNSVYFEYFSHLHSLFSRWIEDDVLEGDPEVYTHSLWGMLASEITTWAYAGSDEPLAGRVDELVDLFLNGVNLHTS